MTGAARWLYAAPVGAGLRAVLQSLIFGQRAVGACATRSFKPRFASKAAKKNGSRRRWWGQSLEHVRLANDTPRTDVHSFCAGYQVEQLRRDLGLTRLPRVLLQSRELLIDIVVC